MTVIKLRTFFHATKLALNVCKFSERLLIVAISIFGHAKILCFYERIRPRYYHFKDAIKCDDDYVAFRHCDNHSGIVVLLLYSLSVDLGHFGQR